jgi:hypothetical protein
MPSNILERIAMLPGLNKAQLLVVWRENFTHPPPARLRKGPMVPLLAYRIQKKEFGGLSHKARKRLEQVAARLKPEKQTTMAFQDGTRLVRTWHGEVHEVSVTDSGFRHSDREYSNLSRIAREVTGTPWS